MKDRKRPVLRMILGTAWAVCVLCLPPGSLTAMAETAPTGTAPAESADHACSVAVVLAGHPAGKAANP